MIEENAIAGKDTVPRETLKYPLSGPELGKISPVLGMGRIAQAALRTLRFQQDIITICDKPSR